MGPKLSVSSLVLAFVCACAHQPADRVLLDASIYTMDPDLPKAQAIALRGDTIVHVGSLESVQAFIDEDTKVERLGGQTILPGLFDSHTHLVLSGTELVHNVQLYEAKTLVELDAAIRERIEADAESSDWIRGSGWEPLLFEGQLDRARLDKLSATRPILMYSSDGHSAWVNSAALRVAGISKSTTAPRGGRIERDAEGEPTGILRETAIALVSAKAPAYDDVQVDAGLRKAIGEANSFGITHVFEVSTEKWMLAGLQRSLERGELTVKVRAAVWIDPARGSAQLDEVVALREAFRSPRIQVNAIKLQIDGVLESGTAAMFEPYRDGTRAKPLIDAQTLLETIRAFDKAGFQIHAHVIGDQATHLMLDALTRLERCEGIDRRPVLAHLLFVALDDLPRFRELGVYAAFSPLWAAPDPSIDKWIAPTSEGERAHWIYPLAAVAQAGGVVVAGSDWSVSSMNPFAAMQTAITRRALAATDGPALEPEQAVSLEAILAAYTIDGARAAFVEDELGSLQVGKRADLVVIDQDPFAIAPTQLSEISVLRTIVDGADVYPAH